MSGSLIVLTGASEVGKTTIAPLVDSGCPVLFEGQMRVPFIREALIFQNIPNVYIILIKREDSTRDARLIQERKQPELANEGMKGWSCSLHSEAVEAGVEILDASNKTLAECVAHIIGYLQS